MRSVKTFDWILRAALVLLAAAFVATAGWGVYVKPQRVVTAGEQAPAFHVAADNGRVVRAPGFGGKLLVLNFWASWCPPCVQETASLSQLARDYAPKGVVVLGISVDSSDRAYRAFLEKYKPDFLTVRESQIHRDFGTFVYPETYFIDSTGKVVQKIAEGADWSSPSIRAYIDSLL